MQTEPAAPKKKRKKRFTQDGMAIIAVTTAIALLTIPTVEFMYATNVDYDSAANARDDVRAFFLARSVMNLAQLVIKVQHDIIDRNRRALAQMGMPDVQIGDFMSLLETPICGGKDEIGDLAKLASIDANQAKGLGIPFGTCRVDTFENEDGKININCANGQPATANAIGAALTGLVAPPAYDKMFEERDGDNQFTDRPTFVAALLDYVDRDEAHFGLQGQSEEYGYEALKDPYRPKNNYIDSVDELQLVRGMDDKKWQLFGPLFTIYGGCKVNVAATQSPITLMGIIWQSAKDPNDPVLQNLVKLWALAQRVAQAKSLGYPFEDLATFANFVKDPDTALGLKLDNGANSSNPLTQASALAGQNMMSTLQPVDGVVLDPQKLNLVAKAGPRRIYRVVGAAQVGRVQKRIIGVWDTETHNQNMTDPAYARGTWVYWREE
jgi:general secretion pathway protein K